MHTYSLEGWEFVLQGVLSSHEPSMQHSRFYVIESTATAQVDIGAEQRLVEVAHQVGLNVFDLGAWDNCRTLLNAKANSVFALADRGSVDEVLK